MSKFLKRKTNRKVKSKVPIEKEFDFPKFKDQMSKEMSRFKNKKTMLNISIDNDYEKCYKQYISEGFTYSTQMIITRMFSDSKTLPKELRNEYPLHSLITKIASQLMMNELEIVYFSIYLDTFGWINDHFDIIEHFLITGLSVKKYLNFNTKYIENFLSVEYPNILEKFNKWLKMQKDYHLLITITPRDVNVRYNLLKRPYNSYCQNNFIDYNEAVDRILQMSLPYGEGGKNHKLVYQPSVKEEEEEEESKPKRKKKVKDKEKNAKVKEDKSHSKGKRGRPNFCVSKPSNILKLEYDKEKMKDLFNLKDDSTNSINNNIIINNITAGPNQIKLSKSDERKRDNNHHKRHQIGHNDEDDIDDQGNDDDNEMMIDKGEMNQNNNYNAAYKGYGNQNTMNLMHNGNSNPNINFNSLPYSNPNYGNYNLDFIKQSSDFNFNGDQLFFGRNTSGIDQVFFRRSSTQNFEGQEELNDAIFKPIDCKQHISFGSLTGDFKLDSNKINMNIPKMTIDDYPKQYMPLNEPMKDNYGQLLQQPQQHTLSNNNFGASSFINNSNNLNTNLSNNPPNNILSNNNNSSNTLNLNSSNNNLIQNNAPAKKNFLFAFQDLKNNKQ